MTKIIAMKVADFVTPKVAAKLKLLFNKLPSEAEAGLLEKKSSCSAPALGVTKFMTINAMSWLPFLPVYICFISITAIASIL